MTQKSCSRILIIDDHPLLRQGIAALINSQKDFTVCGELNEAKQAITVIQKTDPDVVILDLALQGTSGIEVLKNLKVQFPKIRVLVLSMHDESIYAPRALRAGAMGYVMKQEAPEKVIAALRKILAGEVALSAEMGTKMLSRLSGNRSASSLSPMDALSDRELEVFNLLGHGSGTREIANRLHLSVKTIESHRAHIKEKLHLDTAAQLVRHAIQWVGSESEGVAAQPQL